MATTVRWVAGSTTGLRTHTCRSDDGSGRFFGSVAHEFCRSSASIHAAVHNHFPTTRHLLTATISSRPVPLLSRSGVAFLRHDIWVGVGPTETGLNLSHGICPDGMTRPLEGQPQSRRANCAFGNQRIKRQFHRCLRAGSAARTLFDLGREVPTAPSLTMRPYQSPPSNFDHLIPKGKAIPPVKHVSVAGARSGTTRRPCKEHGMGCA